MVYSVEILDSNRNFKGLITNYKDLRYSKKLSEWGTCTFKVLTNDPVFENEGDILQPRANHVRIKRYGVTVWQGIIARRPHRTSDFIDIEARTYLWLLDSILLRHDPADGNGGEVYRTLKSGTFAANISTLINECKADAGSASALSALTLGTIDNPPYPTGTVDAAGVSLTGPWSWTANFPIKFDYKTHLHVLQTLAAYATYDIEVTDNLVLNFRQFIGNRQPNLVFTFGEFGNLEDYDLPEDGEQMANSIVGVAADNNFKILSTEQSDNASIANYGKVHGLAAYADAKSVSILQQRLREELRLVRLPAIEAHIVPKPEAYPYGQYGVGDIVTVDIQDHGVSFSSQPRRIVAIDIKVENTGKERIRILTNQPREV